MANATDVLISLGADTSELQSSIGGLVGQVTGWISGLNPIAAGAVAVVSGLGVAAFESAEKLHEAYNEIIVGTGATGATLDSLKTSFKTVFNDVPQDAAVVGKSIADVNTLLGLQGDNLDKTTKGFLDLSDAVHEDVTPMIEATSQAMNAWGIAGDQATLVQDKLLVASQQTGISVTGLAGALSKGEGVFKQWGLSVDESISLLGNFHKNGIDSGEAIGALQKAIKNLTDNGVAPSKEALLGLVDGIKNAGSETASTQTAIDIFGKSGVQMGAAIREGKLNIDALTESLANAEGQVARTDDATDTIGEKFTILSHNIQTLLEPLGVVLVDALSMVVDGFGALLDPLTYSGDGFQSLLSWLQPIADAFTSQVLPALQSIGTLLLGIGVEVLQNVLIPAFTFLWNNVLVPLGGFLRDSLVTYINGVYGALNSFIGLLKDLPGVSTLFEAGQKVINGALGEGKTKADEAKAATTQLHEAHTTLAGTLNQKTHPALTNVVGALNDKKAASDLAKKATSDLEGAEKTLADLYSKLTVPQVKSVYEAQADVEKSRNTLKTATKNYADAEADLKKKLADSNTSAKDLKTATNNLETAEKAAKTASENFKKAQGELGDAQKKLKDDTDKSKKAFDDLSKELDKIGSELVAPTVQGFGDISSVLKDLKTDVDSIKPSAGDAQAALEALGIQSKEKLKDLADKAEENFKRVRDSGKSSATEVDLAQKTALEAMVGYYKQAGLDVPKEVQTTLDALKGKYETHKTDTVGVFNTMKGAITQSITQLSTDLVKSLWEDPGSFKDKGIQALKTLGESVTTAFITPATNAISGFINGTLSDLLGGKGLGAIKDRLGDLGGAFGGVFGGGGGSTAVQTATGAAGTATQAATGVAGAATTAAGTAAQTAGSAASSAGAFGMSAGMTATLGLVTSAIGAVGSILQAFGVGQGGQKDRLNQISDATTFVAQAYGDRGLETKFKDMGNDISNFVNGSFGGWYHDYLVDQGDLNWSNNEHHANIEGHLEGIKGLMADMPTKLERIEQAVRSAQTTINNTVTVLLDGKEIAAVIKEQSDLDFRLATV